MRLGLDNKPTADQLLNMQYVAKNVFDRVRASISANPLPSLLLRCYALNKTIGGSAILQHCNGEAIDIDGDVLGGVHNADISLH